MNKKSRFNIKVYIDTYLLCTNRMKFEFEIRTKIDRLRFVYKQCILYGDSWMVFVGDFFRSNQMLYTHS